MKCGSIFIESGFFYVNSIFMKKNYALNKQTPPAALIRSSAFFEKYFAFTMIGCFGMCPLPNNL